MVRDRVKVLSGWVAFGGGFCRGGLCPATGRDVAQSDVISLGAAVLTATRCQI